MGARQCILDRMETRAPSRGRAPSRNRFPGARHAACSLALALIVLVPAVHAVAQSAVADQANATQVLAPEPREILARSALLMDATTGEELFAKDADQAIPPASMAKLMTLHLAIEEVEQGRISLDDTVAVGPDAWAANFPAPSSLMFLEPGQRVTVKEIMLGLAVCSGNDAAVALAEHVAGSVDAFVLLMNAEAAALGLDHCRFADPSGLSSENTVTAREFARFCRAYVQAHPWALDELHAVRRFSYPQARNLAPGSSQAPITQENRNRLLWDYAGVDGLKTGYIRSSGYNIAITAERGGRRLIAVIMGGPGETHAQGGANLFHDGALLLDYGFFRAEPQGDHGPQ